MLAGGYTGAGAKTRKWLCGLTSGWVRGSVKGRRRRSKKTVWVFLGV
jgi:hypothetical protein